MSEQKLWIKKRTSRGGGRVVNNRPAVSGKNIKRDVKKNQVAYSHYLLKLCLLFALGLIWLRFGIEVGSFTAVPLGLIVGIIVIVFEPLEHARSLELSILIASTVLSFFLPIGIIL